jgi:hypothetical protein
LNSIGRLVAIQLFGTHKAFSLFRKIGKKRINYKITFFAALLNCARITLKIFICFISYTKKEFKKKLIRKTNMANNINNKNLLSAHSIKLDEKSLKSNSKRCIYNNNNEKYNTLEKHLTWYEYEIQRYEKEKLKTIEEANSLINANNLPFIIAPDGQLPNSIIRQKINCIKFKPQ